MVRELVRDGASNPVLARRLFLSETTIKWHLSAAMQAAKATTRTGVALWWIRCGQYDQEPRAKPRQMT